MATSDEPSKPPSDADIFGKLPDSRPGTRSPRRRDSAGEAESPKPAAKRARGAASAAAKPKPKPAARPGPEPPGRAEPPAPGDGERGQAPASQRGGLEEIAWAGVAVAAEAATLGVRLASKAIDSLRGSTERR